MLGGAEGMSFGPDKRWYNLELSLDMAREESGNIGIGLTPGRHTIRATLSGGMSYDHEIVPVGAISDPIEIEILQSELHSGYKKILPSGSTVELIGMCEFPSLGKKWYKPDGKLLEKPPYDGSGSELLSVIPPDSIPIEFAFRLIGDFNEPAWEAQVKTNNEDFVWWTGRRSQDGEYVRDIKSIGMFVEPNQESINLKLGFSIDGKPHKWAEFNNISVKNIVKANNNVQSG